MYSYSCKLCTRALVSYVFMLRTLHPTSCWSSLHPWFNSNSPLPPSLSVEILTPCIPIGKHQDRLPGRSFPRHEKWSEIGWGGEGERRGEGVSSENSNQALLFFPAVSWGLKVINLYLSQHFILAEIICANQSESKFLSWPLKSCQNVAQGNQSLNFNMGNMK